MDDGNSFASVKSACALAKSGRKAIWIMSAADKTCIMIVVFMARPLPFARQPRHLSRLLAG